MRLIRPILAFLFVFAVAHTVQARIKSPGAHPKYVAELEPHLVVQWTNNTYYNDDGLGVGFRASIPVIDNGPVTTINNNLAIGFGLDWAHFGGCGPYNVCDADSFWIPLVVQWNFFLTPVVSLFWELGLALEHSSLNWDGPIPGTCGRINGVNVCTGDTSRTSLELVLWLGARFTLTDRFSLTLRLGTPSVLFGASFML